MKSKTYWERRSAERLLDNLKDADKMVNSLKSDYQESILNINESIEKLYGKFATDNAVSYNQAVSLIKGKEYKKWRMSMEKYLEEIAKGDEALSLELNVLCMKKRITRLEAIRAEIYANCGKLARIEEGKVTETLTNALERNYYSSMYDYYLDQDKKVLELMHGHQVALSKANIDRVLRMPWSGENYSKNIWKSKYQIASKLQKAVTRSILEGKSIENLTRDVSTELGNDLKHSVRRLIHTETAYVKSQGDLLTYDKLGVDEYEFLATLDNRTSSICRSLDGEHFKLEDATPGVNYPPMHPYCRSTTIVYRAEKDETRAARDDDGETYKVDANLNYKDWYKKYVDGENIDEKGYNKNKIPTNLTMIEATTIKEANKLAENMGFAANYSGMDLKCANEWNLGLFNAMRDFPEVVDKIKFVGASQKRYSLMKKEIQDYYYNDLIEKKYNEKDALKLAKKWANQQTAGFKVGQNEMASSFSFLFSEDQLKDPVYQIMNKYLGITMNNKFFDDYERSIESGKRQVEQKWHPDNCYTVKAIFDHEFGHQIDTYLDLSSSESIAKLWGDQTRDTLKESLSEYAYGTYENYNFVKHESPGEMIAEAWSEFCNNEKPRELAKTIGEEIKKLWKEKKKKKKNI